MKAMLLKAPRLAEENPLEAVEVPVPEPGPDEVRIRVQACGVCHTDLHTVEGDLALPKLPVVPGHQIVGHVESVGANVSRFCLGDRVGVTWLYSSYGQCDYCQRGLENLCNETRFTGLHADGGYAQYTVVPAAFAYPLPQGFPDAQAAPLLCAGVIGYRSLRLSEILPGQRLGLYGFGASAHVTIQVARHWGGLRSLRFHPQRGAPAACSRVSRDSAVFWTGCPGGTATPQKALFWGLSGWKSTSGSNIGPVCGRLSFYIGKV